VVYRRLEKKSFVWTADADLIQKLCIRIPNSRQTSSTSDVIGGSLIQEYWGNIERAPSMAETRESPKRDSEAATPGRISGPQEFEPVFSNRSLVILVALLLASGAINYIDRQVLSILAPTLRDEFHLSNSGYAAILNAFMITYVFSYAFGGWFLDRVGVGRGLTASIVCWSVGGMLTALSRGASSMAAFRAVLALGEGGCWPAFAKASSLWVSPNARSLVMGICNSGSSLGAVIAAPLVVFFTQRFGWRSAFLVTGSLGFVWLAAFQVFRYLQPKMRATDQGQSALDSGTPHVRWLTLFRYRQTWAVFFCRFFADPLWYFYVFWIPEFLVRERGMDLAGMAKVAWIPFLVSGSMGFAVGYLILLLQGAGWSPNRTRKVLMALGAVMSPIGTAAVFAHSVFWTTAFICAAVFFFMFWAVSVHTLPTDYFPPHAVASVYGIGGAGSTLGSVISTWAVGSVLDLTHSYLTVFIGIGLLMPIAFLVGTALMGRVEPIELLEEGV
jgi:MFS transporter, ACS family, hexuronate transporter